MKRRSKDCFEDSDTMWQLVKNGVPDDPRGFIIRTIVPRLVTCGAPDNKIITVCKTFFSRSCLNYGKCENIDEAWIQNIIKLARDGKLVNIFII